MVSGVRPGARRVALGSPAGLTPRPAFSLEAGAAAHRLAGVLLDEVAEQHRLGGDFVAVLELDDVVAVPAPLTA